MDLGVYCDDDGSNNIYSTAGTAKYVYAKNHLGELGRHPPQLFFTKQQSAQQSDLLDFRGRQAGHTQLAFALVSEGNWKGLRRTSFLTAPDRRQLAHTRIVAPADGAAFVVPGLSVAVFVSE